MKNLGCATLLLFFWAFALLGWVMRTADLNPWWAWSACIAIAIFNAATFGHWLGSRGPNQGAAA